MDSSIISRRRLLQGLGLGVVALPLAKTLAACDSDEGTKSSSDTTTPDDTSVAETSVSETSTPDTSVSDDTTEVAWLSGGTAGMSGTYADPFTAPGQSCALICAMTLGPCYAETVVRKDISEGYPGLPVRLALQVVNEACEPVAGAVVDIWHTRNSGLYSGSDASAFCTTGDEDAEAHRYHRGAQTTDANGRVDFDTCFPGWYAGRAIHIHFRIQRDASDFVVSQVFFPQAVIDELFATHSDYSAFGQPDTPNAEDTILPQDSAASYTVEWSKQSDGAMLAWKRLVIRESLETELCDA